MGVCQECTAEDHASVCHAPNAPSSDFAVSALSRPTRATAVTEASRPAKKNKSMSGVVKLWSVSNKSSCASTQDTTNDQLKLKSTNSMTSSENKPRSGSVSKKTNSTVKSNASTKNG